MLGDAAAITSKVQWLETTQVYFSVVPCQQRSSVALIVSLQSGLPSEGIAPIWDLLLLGDGREGKSCIGPLKLAYISVLVELTKASHMVRADVSEVRNIFLPPEVLQSHRRVICL